MLAAWPQLSPSAGISLDSWPSWILVVTWFIWTTATEWRSAIAIKSWAICEPQGRQVLKSNMWTIVLSRMEE